VSTLQKIPPLVAALKNDATNIFGYVDENPMMNSRARAIYQQAPGTVMVYWDDTTITEGEMEAWLHTLMMFVRADKGASPLDIGDLIVNGIPVPGDGLRWRYCPVMDGVLPATLKELGWTQDTEGIDYLYIRTEIKESGDA
jgi:hypothetical protein